VIIFHCQWQQQRKSKNSQRGVHWANSQSTWNNTKEGFISYGNVQLFFFLGVINQIFPNLSISSILSNRKAVIFVVEFVKHGYWLGFVRVRSKNFSLIVMHCGGQSSKGPSYLLRVVRRCIFSFFRRVSFFLFCTYMESWWISVFFFYSWTYY